MPRPRKTNKGNWTEEDMSAAVNDVLDGMSVRAASSLYNIPKSSIQDKVGAVRGGGEVRLAPKLGHFEDTFNSSQEEDLVQFLVDMDSRLMPLTKKEFLKVVYDYAENLKIKHRFNKDKKRAGDSFYTYFMSKHKNLSLRLAQNTSILRRAGFTKTRVIIFYDKLEQLLAEFNFSPGQIFNADETGISEVHRNKKVISLRGKNTVGKMSSGERGTNTTIMFCGSADGVYVPPFFIFGGHEKKKAELLQNSCGTIAKKGWQTSATFLVWLQHFVEHVKPRKENPVLLILDGHTSVSYTHLTLPTIYSV